MEDYSDFGQIARSYLVGRVIFGIIHVSIASVLLSVLYSAHKSIANKGSETARYKYFLYTIISVFFSLVTGLIGVFFDNNFIIDWDYAAGSKILTAADGYVSAFWSISKFTFYVTFLYHIKYLVSKENESAVNMALLNVVTVVSCIMTVVGSVMFTIGDIIVHNPTDELLYVAGFGNNIQLVSYVNDTSNIDNLIRKVGGGICGIVDVIYFLFLMQGYYKLSKNTSTLAIRNEIVRGNVLLFVGSLTTWLFFLCLVNNWPLYFSFLWIDMAFDDCCAVLLLPFTKIGYAALCRLCNACCGSFYPANQYQSTGLDEEQNALI